MFLLAAISLGFLGSLHCVGMCGPIALSLPIKNRNVWNVFLGSLTYNIGRAITYFILGLLFGLFGKGLVLASSQNMLSITLGILLLLLLVASKINFKLKKNIFSQTLNYVRIKMGSLFKIYSHKSLFLIGLLNGLLPCGFLYIAILGAIATGDTLSGGLFMAAFGLGTFPAMLGITMLRNIITPKLQGKLNQFVPVMVGCMAFLLILRGMNLGIPYISPSIQLEDKVCVHNCCHKP